MTHNTSLSIMVHLRSNTPSRSKVFDTFVSVTVGDWPTEVTVVCRELQSVERLISEFTAARAALIGALANAPARQNATQQGAGDEGPVGDGDGGPAPAPAHAESDPGTAASSDGADSHDVGRSEPEPAPTTTTTVASETAG